MTLLIPIATMILQTNSTLPSTPSIGSLGLPPFASALVVSAILGVAVGLILRSGKELALGLLILAVTLYFITGQLPFSLSELSTTFIPLLRDGAMKVYAIIAPGGILSIGVFLGLTFMTYQRIGFQTPAYKKE